MAGIERISGKKIKEWLGEKVGGCASGIVEGEEQWGEKWERYWGSLVRRLGGDDSMMMGEEASDGWDGERRKQKERGRTGKSNCAVLGTSTENTLASCQSVRLAWLIFLLFSISVSLCTPLFLQNVPWHKRSAFLCVLYATGQSQQSWCSELER